MKTVRLEPENGYIALNSWFLYNMIYCEEEDFEFVANYITQRCVNAKIVMKDR